MTTAIAINPTPASVLSPYPELFVRASQLVVSPYQVRQKARSTDYVEGLVASIKAQGLMHALTVHEMPKKKGPQLYGVTAGGGRNEAIQLLLTRNLIDDERDLVRVTLTPVEHAYALSLAENVHREPLHAADEFVGFKRMIDGGESIEDTAAAFGVAPLVVQRRLRLANVEPSFIELFRADEIDLAQLMALATTDNHELQKEVWESAHGYQRNAQHLRAAIVGERIDASKNPLAKFVGIDAYVAAGGALERDLFSHDGASGIIADGLLLQRLAMEKLQQQIDPVRAEGWSWVEVASSFTHTEKNTYREAKQTQRKPTPEESQRLDAIDTELSALLEKQDDADLTDEESARYDVLEAEQNDIEERFYSYAPEAMAHAGAVVTISDIGALKIVRGLVRKEDVKALARDTAQPNDSAAPSKPAAEFSERLFQRITAHQTLAMQSQLASAPTVALAVLIAELAGDVFGHQMHGSYGLDVTLRAARLEQHAENLAENPALAALDAMRAAWVAKFPKKQKDLLPWLLKQDSDELVALLSFCTALSLNCVRNHDRRSTERDVLLDVLDLDMADFWKPSPANFLAHVNKVQILGTVREAVSTAAVQAIQDLKKGPMIDAAFERLAATRWLPKFLRRKPIKNKASK